MTTEPEIKHKGARKALGYFFVTFFTVTVLVALFTFMDFVMTVTGR